MEPEFWTKRWQAGDIGFHRTEVHEYLAARWHSLSVPKGSQVLVPLCGKSVDMAWLAAQGHRVIGVELSPVAVDAFFSEQGLQPTTRVSGPFMIKEHGLYTIWCGDFFALPREAVQDMGAIYDRAALVALPPEMQRAYADKLAELAGPGVPLMLVSLTYDESKMSGPPFSTPLARIAELFGETHKISLVEARERIEHSPNLKARGLESLEEALYILRRK